MTAPLPPLPTYLEMWTEDAPELTDAIQAYAKLAVREALERAAKECEQWNASHPERLAASIRAMIEELDK